jgi:hypothetical protein
VSETTSTPREPASGKREPAAFEPPSSDPDATAPPDPHAEYTGRLAARRLEAERWGRRHRWLSNLRLAVFGLGALTAWLAFGTRSIDWIWVVPPVLGFGLLLVVHDRVIQRRTRADRAVGFYQAGLARLEERWAGSGVRGEQYRDPTHPYAEDLDLFGEGSLFELLCTARTPAGEKTLAGWLLEAADAREVRARQQAVEELRPRLDLREELALLGEDVTSQLDPQKLVRWGAEPSRLVSRRLRLAAAAVAALPALAAMLWIFTASGPIPLLIAVALESAFATSLRKRVAPVIGSVSAPTRDLALLRDLLTRLETEPAQSPRLAALRAALDTEGIPPSQRIAQLQRLVDLLDARRNQLFAPIGALLLWGTQLALAIEHWRAVCGRNLGGWLEAAGEIEALAALATYAYEHPDDPMPEVSEAPGPAFDGRALGHPLLPVATCVRNDLALGGSARRALLMSGSNMSGKSTMLRTVGTNALLALAGAPVRAASLRLSPIAIAASIRVSDSLQQGTSHFYAEIKRLRQVMDLTEAELPVLFLLDEILHGTNSHDRRIGAEAVMRRLVKRGALGIVTTHDLALARIADELAPVMQNVHFEDQIEEGEIRFDYRLRPGVVTKSNALELMRAVGLEV